ncbi:transcriptional regulator [Salmonella enterica subsp. enterica serovar Choleraesuis]|nr:transcriptional regulator [Salmonella enterica subsp. enterica serovar Choleraesuis]
MKRPSWSELQIFITLAEQSNFRRAAELLGMKPSTLSHALKALEAQLQVTLFNRTTRSVALTEAGRAFYARVLPLQQEMDDTLGSITAMGKMQGGTLRINGSDAALKLLCENVVYAFMEQFPGIELDMVVDNAFSDIVSDGFDAGIRLYEDIPQDMVAIRVSGKIQFLTVASPEYLRQAPVLSTPGDLLHHRCIRQRLPGGRRYAWEFARGSEALSLDVPGQLTLNSSTLMAEAASRHQGVAYIPELYAKPWLASGQLRHVLPEWNIESQGLFLYFPHHRHISHAMNLLLQNIRALRIGFD